MNLTKENFSKAKEYIKKNARGLEATIYKYHFEQGSKENILQQLITYQNKDGGFGHGIEPDFTLSSSSPMATTIAFQILSQLKVDSKHEIVQQGIKYFLNTYVKVKQGWISIPKEVNDNPHAPWWHFNEEFGETGFNPVWGNPTAEIIGYLNEYSELVEKEFIEDLTDRAVNKLLSYPDQIEMHEALCFYRLSQRVPDSIKEMIIEKINKSLPNVIGRTPKEWENYSATPLTFIDSPNSSFLKVVDQDLLEMNLDYVIQQQQDDGSWTPNWNWGGHYEESWLKAKEQWKGILTLNMLKVLLNFGRIEDNIMRQ